MTSKEIAQEAIAKMNKRITNEIFIDGKWLIWYK